MEIIEIKGDKESKSRYKVILCGMEKVNGECVAFAATTDRKNPRARFPAGNVTVKGTNRKKVLEQVMAIIATFPPEHDLHFIDLTEELTESEVEGNG